MCLRFQSLFGADKQKRIILEAKKSKIEVLLLIKGT